MFSSTSFIILAHLSRCWVHFKGVTFVSGVTCVRLPSFACGYTVVPEARVEETILTPLNGHRESPHTQYVGVLTRANQVLSVIKEEK